MKAPLTILKGSIEAHSSQVSTAGAHGMAQMGLAGGFLALALLTLGVLVLQTRRYRSSIWALFGLYLGSIKVPKCSIKALLRY